MSNRVRSVPVCVALALFGLAAGPRAAQDAAAEAPPYVVGTAVPEATPGSALVNLTLQEAIDLALENNLELRAARLDPAGVDYQLEAARAAFTPQLSGNYSYRDSSSPNNSALEERNTVNQVTQNYNVGLSQQLRWMGGSFNVSFNNSRQSTNSSIARLNPAYNSSVQFSYTQPLLAGLRIDNARNQLRTLSVQRQIADIALLTTVENTKADVRTAYWNLRRTIDQIEIQRRSLELARQLYEDNLIRVEIGTLAPIETTTSETQVANAEQALLNAQIQWRNAELALKRLLAGGAEDEIYRATINPTELPTLTVAGVDIPAAITHALEYRTDLVQARRNLEISELNLEVTADNTRPSLDLSAGYSASGQGGAQLVDGVREPGGWSDALGQIGGLDRPTWNVGFNFTYPLFMRAARANMARAEVQLDQAEARLQAQELQVTVAVTNAGLAVENAYQQFQAAQKAREVAERNADAEQTRFEVGMSTNYNVVDAQNNLTAQRLSELSAIINYLNAVAEFDRVQRVGG